MSNLNTMPDPYQFLEKISTEELRRLLREDFDSTDEGTPENDEFITKVMEVIAQREEDDPSVRSFDPVAGWADFQKNYYPREKGPILLCEEAQLEKLTHKHRVEKSVRRAPASGPKRYLKRLAFVAAIIGLFMSLLIVAQAAGLDVFGAMARWTNETFHFVTTPADDETAAMRAALKEQDIPTEYAPTWIPAGFQAGEPQIVISKRTTEIAVPFSNGNEEFVYTVTRFASKDAIDRVGYEKNYGDAICYSNGHQLFYLFDNLDSSVAAWSDGEAFTIDISGEIPLDDMTSMIDSIGGQK